MGRNYFTQEYLTGNLFRPRRAISDDIPKDKIVYAIRGKYEESKTLKFRCPWGCARNHNHGGHEDGGDGWRVSHCPSHDGKNYQYYIVEVIEVNNG
jgi:hypothetical protein